MLRRLPAASFLLAFVLGLTSGQDSTDCTSLNVESEDAARLSGANLAVCATSDSQCCTQQYLTDVKRDVGDALLDGLRDQQDDQIGVVQQLVEQLGLYFEDEFISSIRENIPLVELYRNSAPEITAALADLLSRAKFGINGTNPEVNTTQYIVNILTGIKMLVLRLSLINSDQKMCIVDKIDTKINHDAIGKLGGSLEQIRLAYSALIRILNFLRNFQRNLGEFEATDFPRGCIIRAINIGFCGRCKMLLPPLCRNTCGSLVRGCYAAFFSGLRREFNSLWKVLRQLYVIIRVEVQNTQRWENNLFDENELSAILMQCGLTGLLGRKKRNVAFNKLPATLMAQANGLKNVFSYGRSGPAFCKMESSERDFCEGRNNKGLRERRCNHNKLCTSSCQCWEGTTTRATDTEAFEGDEISDQEKNPVFDAEQQDYVQTAIKLGTPVSSFLLSSEFAEVLPQNLTLPEPMPYDAGHAGQGHAMISMATLVGAMVLVFML